MAYHTHKGECAAYLGQCLATADLDEPAFTKAWGSLGVVVFALYHEKLTAPYSVCPHCGFESMTQNGTKLHVKRMHGAAA